MTQTQLKQAVEDNTVPNDEGFYVKLFRHENFCMAHSIKGSPNVKLTQIKESELNRASIHPYQQVTDHKNIAETNKQECVLLDRIKRR